MLPAMNKLAIPPLDEDLVFVCGALRSGTTLLRLMIEGHPGLSNPGEMDFLFERPPLKGGARDMEAYEREIARNRVFVGQNLKFSHGLEYEPQVRDFIRQLRKPGKRLTINVHRHFDRIPSIFPNARYVHLLRDPRDAAKSAIGMGWAGNVFHGVDHWINSERSFEALAAKAPSLGIFQIKNEELIKDPQASLTRLCDFLGVAYDKSMLDYPSRSTYGPPEPKLAEQWRSGLSTKDLGLIEGKAGRMLVARGYELSGSTAITPNGLERTYLRIANSWGRWRFSVRRNGLVIANLEIISRVLKIRALEDFVRGKRAANDMRHLK